jgi:hypothetical protein
VFGVRVGRARQLIAFEVHIHVVAVDHETNNKVFERRIVCTCKSIAFQFLQYEVKEHMRAVVG